ncbi:MAG: hypothetical protein V1720_10980 [bacterium]
MNVNSVGNQLTPLNGKPNYNYTKTQGLEEGEKRDKIEISQEAKLLNSQKVDGKDLQKIKEKIAFGYYNTDEVLSKVSELILKEIKNLE